MESALPPAKGNGKRAFDCAPGGVSEGSGHYFQVCGRVQQFNNKKSEVFTKDKQIRPTIPSYIRDGVPMSSCSVP